MSYGAKLDRLCIDTIRTRLMDAVQKSHSGHPGTAMAMAPVVYTPWRRFLPIRPGRPDLAESPPVRLPKAGGTAELGYLSCRPPGSVVSWASRPRRSSRIRACPTQ
jgi:hypothetical protein